MGPTSELGPVGSTKAEKTTVQNRKEPTRGTAGKEIVRDKTLELLRLRGQAVLSGRLAQYLAVLDQNDTELHRQQKAIFANLAQVPFYSWDYYANESAPIRDISQGAGNQAFVVPVVFQYSFADSAGQRLPQTSPIRRSVSVVVVGRGGIWRISGFAKSSAVEPWHQGRVRVTWGRRSLLLSVGSSQDFTPLVQQLDAAGQHVDSLWGRTWPRVTVAVLPRTQNDLAELLGRPPNTGLDQIAAMTSGEVKRPADVQAGYSSDRVLLNPNGFPALGELGKRVVLRHELTHVATRSLAQQPVPMWLSEGYADYVAYHGLTLDERRIAASAIAKYGKQTSPQLPTRDDFDARKGRVAPAYGGAWLAVVALSRTGGADSVRSIYRQTAGVNSAQPGKADPETAANQAIKAEKGWTRADFIQAWRQEMQRVATARY